MEFLGILFVSAGTGVIGFALTVFAQWIVVYVITGDPPNVYNKKVINRMNVIGIIGGLITFVNATQAESQTY